MQMEKLVKCGLLDVGLTDQTTLTYTIRHKLLCSASLGLTLEMIEDKSKIYEKVVDLVKAEIIKVDATDTEEKFDSFIKMIKPPKTLMAGSKIFQEVMRIVKDGLTFDMLKTSGKLTGMLQLFEHFTLESNVPMPKFSQSKVEHELFEYARNPSLASPTSVLAEITQAPLSPVVLFPGAPNPKAPPSPTPIPDAPPASNTKAPPSPPPTQTQPPSPMPIPDAPPVSIPKPPSPPPTQVPLPLQASISEAPPPPPTKAPPTKPPL